MLLELLDTVSDVGIVMILTPKIALLRPLSGTVVLLGSLAATWSSFSQSRPL